MNFEWLFVDMQLFEFWSVVMVPLASGASLVVVGFSWGTWLCFFGVSSW